MKLKIPKLLFSDLLIGLNGRTNTTAACMMMLLFS